MRGHARRGWCDRPSRSATSRIGDGIGRAPALCGSLGRTRDGRARAREGRGHDLARDGRTHDRGLHGRVGARAEMTTKPRRLVTLGHSYVISANRRLAHEMAVQGGGSWQVTALAPASYRGDLGRVRTQPFEGEANELKTVGVHLDRVPHLMWFSGLRAVLDADWDV